MSDDDVRDMCARMALGLLNIYSGMQPQDAISFDSLTSPDMDTLINRLTLMRETDAIGSHATTYSATELPGMWDESDFLGGATDMDTPMFDVGELSPAQQELARIYDEEFDEGAYEHGEYEAIEELAEDGDTE